jgi:hypothetical protein
MTSRLLFDTEGEVLVAYRLFQLQEDADALAVEIERDDDDIATGGEGGVLFWSAANDHYPRVRIELWSGEPPSRPPGQQDGDVTRDETTFTVSETGRLGLMAIDRMPSDASRIRLPHLGVYRLRAYVRGRAAAGQRGGAEFFHGVERWLLQIWPRDPAAPRDDEDLPEWELI